MPTYKKRWSAYRPKKPDDDPIYLEIRKQLVRDKRTRFTQADLSGLSMSTLRNWERNKVKRPQSISIQMAARLFGYEVRLVKKAKD